MTPKFKISNDERMFLAPIYISNGHWLVKRAALGMDSVPKALKNLLKLKEGSYRDGIKNEPSGDFPIFEQAIPKRDNYKPLIPEPSGVVFTNDDVTSYKFKSEKFELPHEPNDVAILDQIEIGIDPKYVELLRMGHGFVRDANSPLLVLNGPTLDAELVAIIMPRRI